MEEIRLLLLVLLVGIAFSGVVILIAKFQKKRRYLKYIPSAILFAATIACIVKARWFSEGMEGLGYIIFAMLALGSCILTLITAVAIDVFARYNKRRNTDSK